MNERTWTSVESATRFWVETQLRPSVTSVTSCFTSLVSSDYWIKRIVNISVKSVAKIMFSSPHVSMSSVLNMSTNPCPIDTFEEGNEQPNLKSIIDAIKKIDAKMDSYEEKTDKNFKMIQESITETIRDIEIDITDIKKKTEDHDLRLENLEEKMEDLASKLEEQEPNQVVILKEKIDKLQDTIGKMQEYSRKNTLEIHGVPIMPNEDKQMLLECIKDIRKHYQMKITEEHLDEFHRLPSLTSNPIIVKFSNRWICNELKQNRKYKGIQVQDIGIEDNKEDFIYI